MDVPELDKRLLVWAWFCSKFLCQFWIQGALPTSSFFLSWGHFGDGKKVSVCNGIYPELTGIDKKLFLLFLLYLQGTQPNFAFSLWAVLCLIFPVLKVKRLKICPRRISVFHSRFWDFFENRVVTIYLGTLLSMLSQENIVKLG